MATTPTDARPRLARVVVDDVDDDGRARWTSGDARGELDAVARLANLSAGGGGRGLRGTWRRWCAADDWTRRPRRGTIVRATDVDDEETSEGGEMGQVRGRRGEVHGEVGERETAAEREAWLERRRSGRGSWHVAPRSDEE